MQTWNPVREYAIDNGLKVNIEKHLLGNDEIIMYEYIDVPIPICIRTIASRDLHLTDLDSFIRFRSDGVIELFSRQSGEHYKNSKLIHLNGILSYSYEDQLTLLKVFKTSLEERNK